MSLRKNNMPQKIVVIGAGIAGLSAAYYLDKSGYEVLVLESQQSVGGRMRQLELNGLKVNSGARLLYTWYDAVMELIVELGLKDEIQYLPDTRLMCDDGVTTYPVSFKADIGMLL